MSNITAGKKRFHFNGLEHPRVRIENLVNETFFNSARTFISLASEHAGGAKEKQLHLAAIAFAAFGMEASFNRAGSKTYACWDDLDRKIGPRQKMALLNEQLNLGLTKGAEPYQTLSKALAVRDQIAHQKHEMYEIELESGSLNPSSDDIKPESWEEFATQEYANRIVEKCLEIHRLLVKKTK